MRAPQAILMAAAVSIGLLAACGDDTPAGPSNSNVLRVEISGPSTIAPGQTVQFSVIEYLKDGTSRALPTAQWASSNSNLVQVPSSGFVPASQPQG